MTLKDTIGQRIAIALPTKEAWEQAMREYEALGVRWMMGDLPTRPKDRWDNYQESSAVTTYNVGDNYLTYATRDWYKGDGFSIILWEELGTESNDNYSIF